MPLPSPFSSPFNLHGHGGAGALRLGVGSDVSSVGFCAERVRLHAFPDPSVLVLVHDDGGLFFSWSIIFFSSSRQSVVACFFLRVLLCPCAAAVPVRYSTATRQGRRGAYARVGASSLGWFRGEGVGCKGKSEWEIVYRQLARRVRGGRTVI